jgi:sec-independent protein translocase protein TatA
MVHALAMGGNPTAWLLIGLLVLLLFGGSKLPEMMKGLGAGLSAFRNGMQDGDDNEGPGAKPPHEP